MYTYVSTVGVTRVIAYVITCVRLFKIVVTSNSTNLVKSMSDIDRRNEGRYFLGAPHQKSVKKEKNDEFIIANN